jgi:hypothetical protein
MTDEEAMKVWRTALDATGAFLRFRDKPDQAAARVIQAAFAERDATIAALRAEVAELAADAGRYRWLRDHSCPPHNFYISVPDEFHGVRYAPAEVDEYIDEALAKHGASNVE